MHNDSTCNKLVYNKLLPKFTGNIILNSWFMHINKSSGSPDLVSIFILSETLFKTKLKIRNKETCKFQICYKKIAGKFGFTSLQVKHSFNRLEALGLLSKSIKLNKVFITPDIDAINKISDGDFLAAQGNIIPNELFKHILSLNKKTNLLSIILLGEILYWNRPSKYNKSLYGKKVGIDWYTNYAYLQEKFRFSRETIRKALVELEDLGLILRKFEVSESVGRKNYVLVIQLNHEKLAEISIKLEILKTSEDSNKIKEEKEEEEVAEVEEIRGAEKESNLSDVHPRNKIPYIEIENTKNNIDLNLDLNNSKKRIYRRKKSLIDFLPVTEEESEYIAEQSNRDFSSSAINKLANHLGSKYPGNLFMSRKSVINYLIKAAEGEIREVNQLNKIDFRFRDKEEVLNEKILEKIENSKSPYLDTKIKKKIIARFEEKDAVSIIEKSYFPDIEYTKTGEDYKIKIFDQSLKGKVNNLENKIKDIVEDTLERGERNRINRIVFEYGSVSVSANQGREVKRGNEENNRGKLDLNDRFGGNSNSKFEGNEFVGKDKFMDNVLEFKSVKEVYRPIKEFYPLSSEALNKIKENTAKDFSSQEIENLVFRLFKPNFFFASETQVINYLIEEISTRDIKLEEYEIKEFNAIEALQDIMNELKSNL